MKMLIDADSVISIRYSGAWEQGVLNDALAHVDRLDAPHRVLILDVSDIELPQGFSLELERYCALPLRGVIVVCGSIANRWKVAMLQGWLQTPCPLVAVDTPREAASIAIGMGVSERLATSIQ